MKYILFPIMLIFFTSTDVSAIEKDKLQHFAVSAIGTFVLSKITKKPLTSAGIMFTIGIAKEMYDPIFDKNDLAADALGVVTGLLISF